MKSNSKAPKKKPYRSLFSNIYWSIRLQLKHCPLLLFILVFGTPVGVFLHYAEIYLPSLVVSEVTNNKDFQPAAIRVGILAMLILLCQLFDMVKTCIVKDKERYLCYSVAHKLSRKAFSLFYETYEKKETTDLYYRAVVACNNWNNGRNSLTELPKQTWALAENILSYLLFGTVISFVSPWLILFLTVSPVINYFSVKAYQNWEYQNRSKWTDLDTKLSYVNNKPADFAASKDIHIYGMAGWFRELYHSLSKEKALWDKKIVIRSFISNLPELLVILLRDGIAYAILIAMAIRGEITVDKFVLYFAAIASFGNFVGGIISTWNNLHAISLNICDLREFFELPEQDGTGEAKIADFLNSAPEITFQNVSYRYAGAEKNTLNKLNFTIKRGEHLALVGLNGAGKTTLVKLLCGLYLPTEGDILINGVSIHKFKRRDYYRLFSTVFQGIHTGFFSLAETVSCTSEAKTNLHRAEECMKKAGLTEKLKTLPNGIHTKLDKQANKDGTELSGGEAQKLMLARALYKDAPILVLDEPTSALDPIAENEIYLKYNDMAKNKTSLFISHRLASTRFCDRIFYLENGVITEEGTHESLLSFGGEYAKLYEMQSCWYRVVSNDLWKN